MNISDFDGTKRLSMARAERLYQAACAAAIIALIGALLGGQL